MGPQRTSALTVTDTSSFSEIEYGGHNQTVRYDGVISPTWLVEGSFARAINSISETPSVDEWRVTDTTVVPQVITGGIGFYEKGNEGTNLQYVGKDDLPLRRSPDQGRLPLRGRGVLATSTSARGRRSRRRTGARRSTGAQVNIVADPAFSRIYRVTRANFNDATRHDAELLVVLRAGHLARRRAADHQPGPPLRGADAGRQHHRTHDAAGQHHRRLPAQGQLGAAHRRRLRRARQRQEQAVRQLRPLLRAHPERPRRARAVGRRRCQPHRLLRRQPHPADPEWRARRRADQPLS